MRRNRGGSRIVDTDVMLRGLSAAWIAGIVLLLASCADSDCNDTNDCDPKMTASAPTLTAIARITPAPTSEPTERPTAQPTWTSTALPSTEVPRSTHGPPPTGTPAPLLSGISGIVLIGPQCPVVREGEECPDKPYEAIIEIGDVSGRAIATTTSGSDGLFRVVLPPGTYTLTARPPTSRGFPAPAEMTVTVESTGFTDVVVSMDSGIR